MNTKRKKTGRKLLSFLLTLAMLVGLMPGMGLTVYASQIDVNYLDASGSTLTISATPVTNSDTTWSTGWYVVNSILTNENRITVNGTVNLILCDGAKLTANAGIAVENDNTLNIYEGWTGERDTTPTVGELSATGGDGAAGIGSKPSSDGGAMSTAVTGGNIIINGGTVTATGSSGAAGIGGGRTCSGGNVTINGGTVTATGGKNNYGDEGGMGIGKGYIYSDGLNNGNLTLGTGVKLETSSDNTNWTDTTSTPATRTRYMKTTITAPAHTHSFTYSISGTTITATCNADDCTLPDVGGNHTATLTIAAPANLTYDGSAKAAVITDENHIQGTTKIQYQTKNGDSYGTATETAPTDPGTYKASITLGEATASVEYTITATPLSITGATLTSRAYAKDNKSVDVTAVTFSGGTPTIGTDYTATAEMADDTAGDSKAVTVTVTLINQNYSLATNTFNTTVNISKKKPAKPAVPTAENITDTSVMLTATEGYQYKRENGGGWQDSNAFTGLTENTQYLFYQRVKGDDNHSDSDSSDALVIKTKQEPISYTVYSKSGNFIVITTKTITEYIKAQTTNNTVWLNDGDFYVVKGEVTVNNGLVYSGNVTIILCDNSKLTIKGGIWHYGSDLTIYGQDGQSGEIVVEGDKNITLDSVPNGIDASTISKDSALNGGSININGGKLSVTPGAGQNMCGTGATIDFLSNVSFTGRKEGGAQETLTEGTYGASKLNEFKSADFTVKPMAAVTTAPTVKTGLTYNGSAQKLVTAGTATGGEMQYALGTATEATEPYTTSIPAKTNAGTYYVWYKVVGDENHSDTEPFCVTVTIASVKYPLWVNGKQVTGVNAENITGAAASVASYDADTNTLTLSGYTSGISDENDFKKGNYETDDHIPYAIYYDGGESATPLTVNLAEGTVNTFSMDLENSCGIYSDNGSLIITGEGTLKVEKYSYIAIGADKDVTIKSGKLNITNETDSYRGVGIYGENISITGGTVNGTKNENVISGKNISITGGKTDGSGNFYGIVVHDGGSLKIGSKIESMVLSGEIGAFNKCSVYNEITGIGWTDREGTKGKTDIPVNTDGADLSEYKKVVFPGRPMAEIKTAPSPKKLIFTGSAQELINAGTAGGGEMQYALGTDDKTAPAEGWSADIPKATDAGTYYVWYKAAGDDNHTDSPEAYVTVTISKPAGGTATINVETSATTYGDSIEFHMQGVPGQEYIIVPKGTVITDVSWSDPVLPVGDDYYSVTFDKLEPATEYEIYTRVAATTATAAGEPVKADIHTGLGSISSDFPGLLVGTTVTVNPEPDTVTGLSYKWYQNNRSAVEEGYYIDNLTEISGASGNSYTFSDKDAGKCIHVKIFKGSFEVGEWDTYEPVSYGKAVFNSMGGSFVADQTGLVYNSRITKPEDPVRTGYTFVGWFKEGDEPGTAGDVKWDFDTEPVVWETTTLLAKWTANTEKTSEVDFKSKDKEGDDIETSVREVACGNLNDFAQSQPEDKVEVELVVQPKTEEEIKNNEPAALESIMKTVEQTFKGTNEGNRKNEFLDMSVVKTVNSVKKAVSDTDVLEIALRYNMTGKFNPMIFRYHNGNTAAFRRLSARPARGSYTDGTFHVEGSGADAIIYIYSGRFSTYSIAYTEEKSWQVTFDDRNGNADQSIVAHAKTVTEPANPSRSGYTFGGWYKDAACTNAWNFTTDTVTGDITLYAKWTAPAPYVPVNPYVPSTPVNTTHTIKFDANGGSGTMASFETSGAATIPANKFTHEGYVFEGWNTKADGSGVSYMDKDDISPSADITLYAQWKAVEPVATPTPEPVPATVDTVTKEEKAQGKIDINSAFKVYQSGKKVVAEWGEVEDADLYEVYATYCGGTYSLIKTVTDGSLTFSFKKLDGVKIDFSKNFKVYVAAYRTIDGEKKLIAKTIKAHVVGSENKKRTNASSIELEKSKYSVKVGNTFEIKATTILVDPKKKQLSNAHAAEFRYLSTDTSIAKVSKDGTVTGVSKGTCYIWVYSRNGLGVKVKVTVK